MNEAFPPVVVSRAVVLRVDNVDTDVITPIARVLEGREAVIRYAFEPIRFDGDGGSKLDDPFSDPARASAQILLAGRNFGCGSSRETAAVAVRGMGFRVVIAQSFGDIFYSNCLKNGVVAIRTSASFVARLMLAADDLAMIAVDLPAQSIRCADRETAFEIGGLQKEMLLSGLDEIGMMQARGQAHADFTVRDRIARPWVRDRVRIG